MPKLKFNDYLVDDEDNSALKSNTPTSNTYGVKPPMITGHGLSNLKDLINSMSRREREQMQQAAQAIQTEPKPKRKYTKRAKKIVNPIKKFKDIKGRALAQVIATLDALNCSYKIISADNQTFTRGVVFGGKEGRKRRTDRPYGMVAAYYKPYIVGLKVGETATIPAHKEISADDIQGSATAWMAGTWGKGSYASMINKSREVEVLRIK